MGFIIVTYWIILGMFATGYAKPERSTMGEYIKNTDIIASCCVDERVEIKSPAPRVVKRYIGVEKNNKAFIPPARRQRRQAWGFLRGIKQFLQIYLFFF